MIVHPKDIPLPEVIESDDEQVWKEFCDSQARWDNHFVETAPASFEELFAETEKLPLSEDIDLMFNEAFDDEQNKKI